MVAVKQDGIQFRKPKPGTVYQSRLERNFSPPPDHENTLPKAFLQRVKMLGDKTAERKKRYGVWQEYSWNDIYEHVSNFFHGLVSLGLEAGDTVCIIGDNDPEMYWTQIAVHSARAQSNASTC